NSHPLLARRSLQQSDALRHLERPAPAPSFSFDAAAPPAHRLGLQPEIVLQDAAYPYVGRDLVLGEPDRLPGERQRPVDAAVGADIDAGMAEQARNEGRDAHVVV